MKISELTSILNKLPQDAEIKIHQYDEPDSQPYRISYKIDG